MSASTTLIGALYDSPAFGKQQPGFGSRKVKHVACVVRTKINTVDPLRKLFDKADAHLAGTSRPVLRSKSQAQHYG